MSVCTARCVSDCFAGEPFAPVSGFFAELTGFAEVPVLAAEPLFTGAPFFGELPVFAPSLRAAMLFPPVVPLLLPEGTVFLDLLSAVFADFCAEAPCAADLRSPPMSSLIFLAVPPPEAEAPVFAGAFFFGGSAVTGFFSSFLLSLLN